ncbi:MAG: hypothetical protein DMF61_26620 [Blastocatellia bacterium AA13]|nr:MAG: hypothetical protein DMF61_26620 [Blastocatellia bacterium AA13]
MPNKKKAKAEEWLSRACWLDLFGESITELPDRAERIMLLMTSLAQMIEGNREEREAARRAVQNCVEACIPYTRAQILAESAVIPRKQP